jgi:hypothetical protein
MADKSRPGADKSDRAGENVLGGTLPHITRSPHLQLRSNAPCRVIGWRVSKWLAVEAVEVRNG